MAEYIDREVALSLVQPDAPEDEKSTVTIATAKKLVRSIVYRTPTADVAPVVHGRWIMGTGENGLQIGHRKCSRCGEIIKYGYSLYGVHNFCNYCGADMRGRTMDVMKGPIKPMGMKAKEDGRKEKENILCEMHY